VKTCPLLFLLLLTISSVTYPKDKTKVGFSGEWVLAVDKSKFEAKPKPIGSMLTILYHGSRLHLDQVTTLDNGKKHALNLDLVMDSKDAVIKRDGSYTAFRYGDSLGLDREVVAADGSGRGIDMTKYTLANDGQTLVAEEKNQTPDGQVYNNVWVFKRK
jgi:hypothetical protein